MAVLSPCKVSIGHRLGGLVLTNHFRIQMTQTTACARTQRVCLPSPRLPASHPSLRCTFLSLFPHACHSFAPQTTDLSALFNVSLFLHHAPCSTGSRPSFPVPLPSPIHACHFSLSQTTHPSTLFNVSRFLLMRTLNREPPVGVSLANVVYILSKQAMVEGAFKLARFAYNKLQVRNRWHRKGWGGV